MIVSKFTIAKMVKR